MSKAKQKKRAVDLSDVTEAELAEVLSARPETFERCDDDGTRNPDGKSWRLTDSARLAASAPLGRA
jgi:hypothetical protein